MTTDTPLPDDLAALRGILGGLATRPTTDWAPLLPWLDVCTDLTAEAEALRHAIAQQPDDVALALQAGELPAALHALPTAPLLRGPWRDDEAAAAAAALVRLRSPWQDAAAASQRARHAAELRQLGGLAATWARLLAPAPFPARPSTHALLQAAQDALRSAEGLVWHERWTGAADYLAAWSGPQGVLAPGSTVVFAGPPGSHRSAWLNAGIASALQQEVPVYWVHPRPAIALRDHLLPLWYGRPRADAAELLLPAWRDATGQELLHLADWTQVPDLRQDLDQFAAAMRIRRGAGSAWPGVVAIDEPNAAQLEQLGAACRAHQLIGLATWTAPGHSMAHLEGLTDTHEPTPPQARRYALTALGDGAWTAPSDLAIVLADLPGYGGWAWVARHGPHGQRARAQRFRVTPAGLVLPPE